MIINTRTFHENIKIINIDTGEIQEAIITYSMGLSYLIFNSIMLEEIKIDEVRDFFTAFMELRKKLEGLGYLTLCKGANKNLHPTSQGMSMGMGLGLLSVKDIVEKGLIGKDIVSYGLFDYAPLEEISTVEEQEKYYKVLYDNYKNTGSYL